MGTGRNSVVFLRNCLGVAREFALSFFHLAFHLAVGAASRKQSAFNVCEKFEHDRGSPLKKPDCSHRSSTHFGTSLSRWSKMLILKFLNYEILFLNCDYRHAKIYVNSSCVLRIY